MAINYSKFLPASPSVKAVAPKINYEKFLPKESGAKVTVKDLTAKKDAPQKERVVTLSDLVGGGQYKTAGPGTLIKSDRSQAPLPSKEGYERDHKVPVSLGGVSTKENLQYLAPKKAGPLKSILNFFKEDKSPQTRQGGKVAVEQKAAQDLAAGRISVPEARLRVIMKNQDIQGKIPKQGILKNLPKAIKETVIDPIKEGVKETGNFIKTAAKSAVREPGKVFSLKDVGAGAKEIDSQIKSMERALPRAVASSVLNVTNKDEYTPKGKIAKTVLGEEPIKSSFKETTDAQKGIQAFLEKKGMQKGSAIASSLIAAPAFIGSMKGLDLTPIGGEESAAKGAAARYARISRLADEGAIARELKTFLPASDSVIEEMASKLKNTTKYSEVKNIIEQASPSYKKVISSKAVVSPQVKQMAEKARPELTAGSKKTIAAFEQSANHDPIATIGKTKFELGDFGKNRIEGKSVLPDRFDSAELKDTLENTKGVYKANTDPANYRSGNKAWVAEMPNGEKRVVYTRPNKNGAEEIINWHKVDETKNPKYLSTLESFGAADGVPDGTRTHILEIEARKPVQLTDRNISTIPANGEAVKALAEEPLPKRLTLKDVSERLKQARMASEAAPAGEAAGGSIKKGMDWLKAKTVDNELLGIRRRLNPIKYQEPETKAIFENWYKSKAIARERANAEVSRLPQEGKAGLKSIIAYEKGIPTDNAPQIKQEFDRLHQQATAAGLEVNYRENYLPHLYANSEKEVKTAVAKYMSDKGVDQEIIKNYLSGVETLPEEVSNRLKLNPGFTKERVFPDYETAIHYGLTPRYSEPAQLLGHYRNELETTIANKNLLDELRGAGKIKDSHSLGKYERSWEPITLPFSPKGYFADPKLAQMLNDLFRNEEALGPLQKATKFIGNASKNMQSFVLSAGIPKTSFNFLSIGQLINEATALRLKSIIPFIRSNSLKHTAEWFASKEAVLRSMAEEGIDLSGRIGNFETIYKKFTDVPKWRDKIGMAWSKVFDEKTFASFIPQLQVQLFEDVQEKAIKKGMSEIEARAIAGDTVKAFYGLNQMTGRGKTAEDALSAVFFAPKFREGMINSLWNTVKSGSTEIMNPAFKYNRRLLAGMAVTYAGYDTLNYKLTGHHMWDNPPGKEAELMIPLKNGEVIYIAFMPSKTAVPRNFYSVGVALNPFKEGGVDLPTAGNKLGQNASMPLKLASELAANRDHFGRKIYNDDDSTAEKLKKSALYSGLSLNHPFIQETYNTLYKDQPLYQSILKAIEFPAKFSTMSKIEQQQLYEAEDKRKAENKKKVKEFLPTYNQIDQLFKEGRDGEAQAMIKNLSDADYAMYKKVKQVDKADETKQFQKDIYDIAVKIRDLDAQGRTNEANQLYSQIPADHLHAYSLLKKKLSSR